MGNRFWRILVVAVCIICFAAVGAAFAQKKVGGGDVKMLAMGKMPLVPKLRPERHEVAAMFERAAIVGRRRGRHGNVPQAPAAAGTPPRTGGMSQ